MSRRRRRQVTEIIGGDPSKILQQLKELQIPHCATCYGEEMEDTEEGDEKIHLLPLPPCSCLMKLITGPLPHPVSVVANDIDTGKKSKFFESLEAATTPTKIISSLHLSELQLKRYNHIPMCKLCLKKMIEVSSQVIELEYRDANQTNPKFTVEAKCPHCSAKFSHRGLERLMSNGRDNEWKEAIANTKSVVKCFNLMTKILAERELKSKPKTTEKVTGHVSQTADNRHSARTQDKKKVCQEKFICLDDSTSCSTESDSFEESPVSPPPKQMSIAETVQHQFATPGEVFQELLKRDPLLKQEHDDFYLIQKLMQSAEGRKQLGILDPDEEAKRLKEIEESDRRYAEMLQVKLNRRQNHTKDTNSFTTAARDTKVLKKRINRGKNNSSTFESTDLDRKNNSPFGMKMKNERKLETSPCELNQDRVYDFVNMSFINKKRNEREHKIKENVKCPNHRAHPKYNPSHQIMNKNHNGKSTSNLHQSQSNSSVRYDVGKGEKRRNGLYKNCTEIESSDEDSRFADAENLSLDDANHIKMTSYSSSYSGRKRNANEVFDMQQSKKVKKSSIDHNGENSSVMFDKSRTKNSGKSSSSTNSTRNSNGIKSNGDNYFNAKFKQLQSNRRSQLSYHEMLKEKLKQQKKDPSFSNLAQMLHQRSTSKTYSKNPPSSPFASSKNNSSTKDISDRDVSSLVIMGFPRAKAKECLQICNGNLTMAVSMMSKTNQF